MLGKEAILRGSRGDAAAVRGHSWLLWHPENENNWSLKDTEQTCNSFQMQGIRKMEPRGKQEDA